MSIYSQINLSEIGELTLGLTSLSVYVAPAPTWANNPF